MRRHVTQPDREDSYCTWENRLSKKHMIAVNFSRDETINWAATQANIKIINDHYVAISDFSGTGRVRNGAVEISPRASPTSCDTPEDSSD